MTELANVWYLFTEPPPGEIGQLLVGEYSTPTECNRAALALLRKGVEAWCGDEPQAGTVDTLSDVPVETYAPAPCEGHDYAKGPCTP
jgi:hypothetical protein